MIVDTSAIIAILEQEPEANFFEDRLLATSEKFMAAPSLLEACMVASGRWESRARSERLEVR